MQGQRMRGAHREFWGAGISHLAWRVSSWGHIAKISEAVCKDCFLHALCLSSVYVCVEAQSCCLLSSSVALHLMRQGLLLSLELYDSTSLATQPAPGIVSVSQVL